MQPDGTMIGPGATAPGGWLRVAKEGGKHLIWSAEYTGAGRQLDYNDLGYMQRQNLETLQASVGWRTLEPGKHTVDTTSALVISDSRNMSGLDLGQGYELNTRLHLLDFWSVFLAADYAPARFDDREVGDGTALERAAYVGGKLEYDSDPRRAVFATHRQPDAAHGRRHLRHQRAGERRLPRAPPARHRAHPHAHLGGRRVPLRLAVGRPDDPLPLRQAGRQERQRHPARQLHLHPAPDAADLRAGVPRLRPLHRHPRGRQPADHGPARPRASPARRFTSPTLASSAAVVPGTNPDFEEAAINASVVFRWEYRLGSLLYLVYTRSQIPGVQNLIGPAMLAPRDFGHGATTDVVLAEALVLVGELNRTSEPLVIDPGPKTTTKAGSRDVITAELGLRGPLRRRRRVLTG